MKKNIYFRDRGFENGDKLFIANYNALNNKWILGSGIRRYGQLHYIILVDGVLLRYYLYQIRPSGDCSIENQNHVPDWIYLSRNGETGKESSSLATMTDKNSSASTQKLKGRSTRVLSKK